MSLYFAYGSNLNLPQMSRRCPDAVAVGTLELPNWKLVFRGVADIVREDDASVHGGLWKITDDCELALDRYEGFNPDYPDAGMYAKTYLDVDGLPDGETQIMFYTMNSIGIYPPSAGYFASIKHGYADFELPFRPLMKALEAAYDDKHPSHVERQRARRNGRPTLAARPSTVTAEDKRPLTRKQERKAEKRAARKAERKAVKKANAKYVPHDPWAQTSWGARNARPGRERMSLDRWLEEKYYDGRRT